MVFVRAEPGVVNPESPAYRELLAQVRDLEVGGVVLFRTPRDTVPVLLNDLQAAAPLPLLVAADVERSVAFRVPEGSVDLPWAMAIGATGSREAARFAGELTARESRALGIHWALGPVADVNNNPENPVINTRSFGEDPERVAELAAAWIEGARAGGLLTTAKHFPGHGDTALDSHLELPSINGDRARLERVELRPFRAAIAAGVDAVMLGHLLVPALDPSVTPASLSAPIGAVLRDELNFQGLAVSDALDMEGVGGRWIGAAAIDAVLAGTDVVMVPADPRVAVQSLVRAVAEGQIDESRLDRSVRRVLAAKARLGLDRARRVDADAARFALGRAADQERADEIARRSITVVRNRGEVLPLRSEAPLRLLHLVLATEFSGASLGSLPADELRARDVEVETRRLGPQIADSMADEIATAAAEATQVLVSAYVPAISGKGNVAMDPTHAALVERLAAGPRPVLAISYGNPYVLRQFPGVPVYLCAYGANESSQRAAIGALFGEFAIGGKLPVSIPGLAGLGAGLELARREQALVASTPEAAGFRADGIADVRRALDDFVGRGAFPGGVLAVGHGGRLLDVMPFGNLTHDGAGAVTPETLYDIASLTKIVATTTMAMMLVDGGRLSLDTPVDAFLPRFRGAGKERVTVRHLLSHSSGMDWWGPLYKELRGKPAYLERIQSMDLVAAPGSAEKYSDLGIFLLGEILERVAGETLDAFAERRLFAPLGMSHTGFLPLASGVDPARIAPTENDPWRGRVLRGEVHDENAFALGGVAPHAGLFSTAGDLARYAQMILWRGVYDHHRVVRRATVEQFTRRAGLVPGSSRALGWDTKSPSGSSAGTLFSADAFGHTGFTGTSLWIDPDRELFVILLTNHVHPQRGNKLIREARSTIADAVVRALRQPSATPGRRHAAVATGLERLAAGEVTLAGKRVGLIAHAASVTREGRHAIDVLRDRGVEVARVFAPEHGLRGQAAAGERVASAVDEQTGLPVVSLYGERRSPASAELRDLDALVVDLQDAGVRFYTYSSTLILALEAAAEAGIELVVLDRPNPLGGERVAGPRSAAREVVPASLLNMAPGPLVHGLTLGEMARHVNARRAPPARLTVIEMTGWQRAMTWRDTGRAWVPPSPNLRTPEAALVYPGVALLESTNLSEGRGTDAPFLLFGAPWLDPEPVRVEVPGFRLGPAGFTPRASPAAPQPKHQDVECRGFRVEVVDPRLADPFRLGVTLLAELAGQPGFEWLRDGAALTTLVGSPNLLEMLRAGEPVERILADDEAALARWREERRPALLYPEGD